MLDFEDVLGVIELVLKPDEVVLVGTDGLFAETFEVSGLHGEELSHVDAAVWLGMGWIGGWRQRGPEGLIV